jgi:acetoin utilization deacetylase AcuC-like enzyme
MNELCYFYPEGHELHFEADNPERPARIEAIQQSLDTLGYWQNYPKLQPLALPSTLLETIHSPELLHTLSASGENRSRIDGDTFLTPHSWALALNSAGGAAAVAEGIYKREAAKGFALCRPPGHHATPHRAMGFCLLNNVALAAQHLLDHTDAKRIAILDIDVHHGNGTQDIFYERGDVLFLSIHQLPLYPGTGHVAEIGRGAGEGSTINMPLPPYSGDHARTACTEAIILPALSRFAPDMVLVSAGFDAHWKDPLAHQLATANGYGALITSLVEWTKLNCAGRLALILEGGYDLNGIATSASACVAALLNVDFTDPIGASAIDEEDDWQPVIEAIKQTHQLG